MEGIGNRMVCRYQHTGGQWLAAGIKVELQRRVAIMADMAKRCAKEEKRRRNNVEISERKERV